ncbi:hypothetical protein HDU93_007467 [Gonapodya sp. JEL0774]|nr:hypothetical protein HDU93_007467 [Gonapodya sp. JEL0774]
MSDSQLYLSGAIADPEALLDSFDKVRRHFVRELFEMFKCHPIEVSHPSLAIALTLDGITLDSRPERKSEVERVSLILAGIKAHGSQPNPPILQHVHLTLHRLLADYKSCRITFITALNRNSNTIAVSVNQNSELKRRLKTVLLVLERDCEKTVSELAKWMLDELALRDVATSSNSGTLGAIAPIGTEPLVNGQPDNRQYIIVHSDWAQVLNIWTLNIFPQLWSAALSSRIMVGLPPLGNTAAPPQAPPPTMFSHPQPVVMNVQPYGYALKPIKFLRWKPPQPLDPDQWFQHDPEGILEGKQRRGREAPGWNGDEEDVLYLNVWCPWLRRISRARNIRKSYGVPIIVYFHANPPTSQQSSQRLASSLNPASLVALHDVVFIEAHVRSGVFGRGVPPETSNSDTDTEGLNLTLLDMRMALEWVLENAEAFGGDVTRVVLAGSEEASVAVRLLTFFPIQRPFLPTPADATPIEAQLNLRVLLINPLPATFTSLDTVRREWAAMRNALGGASTDMFAVASAPIISYDQSLARPAFRPVLAPPLPAEAVSDENFGPDVVGAMVVKELAWHVFGDLKEKVIGERMRVEAKRKEIVDFAWGVEPVEVRGRL